MLLIDMVEIFKLLMYLYVRIVGNCLEICLILFLFMWVVRRIMLFVCFWNNKLINFFFCLMLFFVFFKIIW